MAESATIRDRRRGFALDPAFIGGALSNYGFARNSVVKAVVTSCFSFKPLISIS